MRTVGHGGLGIWANKPEWIKFFGWFGISPSTVDMMNLSQWVGLFEIALGLAVFIKPIRSLPLVVLVWKAGTELLRPLVGQNDYQFIERAGDYVLPVTLIWVLAWLRTRSTPYLSQPAWTAPTPTPAPVPLTVARTNRRQRQPGRRPPRGHRNRCQCWLRPAGTATATATAPTRGFGGDPPPNPIPRSPGGGGAVGPNCSAARP